MAGNQRYYKVDELFALLDSMNLALAGCIEMPDDTSSPYGFVYLPDDATAHTLCSRSFIMKKIMRHWVTVQDLAEWNAAIAWPYPRPGLHNISAAQLSASSASVLGPPAEAGPTFSALQTYIHNTFGTPLQHDHSEPLRFKLECHRYGKGKGFTKAEFEETVDQIITALKIAAVRGGAVCPEQREKKEQELEGVEQWRGVVDLVQPEVVLCFWEVRGNSHSSTNSNSNSNSNSDNNSNSVRCDNNGVSQQQPQHVGRLVFDNSRRASKVVDTFHLRKGRPFLGPTSMDCELVSQATAQLKKTRAPEWIDINSFVVISILNYIIHRPLSCARWLAVALALSC